MGIDAVALLRIPFAELTKNFERHEEMPDLLRGANGAPLSALRISDATLVSTFARFATEPEELSAALRSLLGETLDRHEDDRGIYVFPDVASPQAHTYEALIEELGEVGFWVPMPARRAQRESPPDLGALLAGGLPGGLPGGGDLVALADVARQQLEAMGEQEREQLVAMARQFGLPIGDPNQLMAMLGGLAGAVANVEDAAAEPAPDELAPDEAEEEGGSDDPR